MPPKMFGVNLRESSRTDYVKTTYVTFRGTKQVTFRVGAPGNMKGSNAGATRKEDGFAQNVDGESIYVVCVFLVVILESQMRNQIFAAQVAQGVLEFH
jgi:hypothetical protein